MTDNEYFECHSESIEFLELKKRTEAATGGCSMKEAVVKNFPIFTGKHLWILKASKPLLKNIYERLLFEILNCSQRTSF